MSDRLGYGAVEDRTMPAVVYGLYLLAFATVVTAFIGLVIAYAQRDSAGPRTRSHYTFLIRTFWMSIAWWIIGGCLAIWGAVFSVILIGLPFLAIGVFIMGVVGVWWALRCILGVIYLARDEPYPRPYAWLA
ncbi:hypothetical protein [Phenylobacterium sp. J367]|uniref:DUF4870 family protein n=1 Tax=Phenylobacterium sp. J367 TaxID=2898435 RepID=UPI0021512CDE|nr:hypothetical protein [Phenylobacterium sp. J367]MCR5877348.1 hypothetical protein [Phenylobacterium sp. J367]